MRSNLRHFPDSSLEQAILYLLVFWCFFFAVTPLHAVENGYSNYIPILYGDSSIAVVPSDSNFFLRNEIHHYSSSQSINLNGVTADLDLDYTVNYLTGVYFSDFKIFGARYAVGAILPYANLEGSEKYIFNSMELSSRQESQSGIADIVVMPLGLFWQSGNLHYSLWENITIPTASYDSSRIDNLGLNYYSFNTTFSMTYLDQDSGHDFSFAFGHFYNTENDDTNYKSGQEIHVNWMLNQFFSPSFGLGIHGFYYKQITGDSGNGAILGDFKGELMGVGPAIVSTFEINDLYLAASFRWIHEFKGTNRFEGDHVSLSISALF